MATAHEAFQDSKIDLDNVNLDRAGVVWGSGIGGMKTFQEECFNYKDGDGSPRFNPFFVPKMIVDIAAGHISIKYGLKVQITLLYLLVRLLQMPLLMH